MKGFTPALTASRLEQMLAFYMKPEDRSESKTDERTASDHGKHQHEHRDMNAEAAHPGS